MGSRRLRIVVAAGGVAGAALRLLVLGAAGEGTTWRWLTVGIVNIVGCFVVGAAVAAADRWTWPAHWRLAATVGVCGGLTTFSTVAVEVALALDDGAGQAVTAIAWSVGSLVLGVAAVIAGRAVAGGGAVPTEGSAR